MSKQYFTVYKTTNIVNNRYYIGAHSTNKLDDGYLGSGKILLKAIRKYGKQNFTHKLLHVFDNPEQMYLKERELVNHKDPQSYNIKRGGEGGSSMEGKLHKQSTKDLLSKIHKGAKHSPETLDKLHQVKLGNQYRARKYKVTFPDGTTVDVTNLKKFCVQHGLPEYAVSCLTRRDLHGYKGFVAKQVPINTSEYEGILQ